MVETKGLGTKWDRKIRGLIRVIKVTNSLDIKYEKTNILTPLMYAESSKNIPWRLNTQGILFTRVTQKTIEWIKNGIKANRYGKHIYDMFWLPLCKDIFKIKAGDMICIFNRRVAGWDGSHERPVIELLGAGGHLPTVWNTKDNCFVELGLKQNFQKEFEEELGGRIKKEDIVIFGGYQNDVTHELVVLCAIEINDKALLDLQEYAIQNIDEDTAGIYFGTFEETIKFYQKNPTPFAGGKKSAPYNFPNQRQLMGRVIKYLELQNRKYR